MTASEVSEPLPSVGRVDRCPACGATDFVTVGPPSRAFAVDAGGRRFVQPPFQARQCRSCSLVFKSATASAAELDAYYRDVDSAKWENPALFPSEAGVLAALEVIPAGSRVLDFGCSRGRLLRRLVGRHQCYGFEINAEAARIASSQGIAMLSRDALFGPNPEAAFDVILLVDVFEHLSAPTELLRALVARLAPGGTLVVCTGTSDAASIRADPANAWYFQNIEHLVMLNRRHADYLSTALALTLARWTLVSHYDWTWRGRLLQRSATFAFEVFHRERVPWLKPLLRQLPGLRKAEHWETRPNWSMTKNHAIITWTKRGA